MKDYTYNGLRGCVVQCMSLPGGAVGLYHAKQAHLDATGGPWVTMCERHRTLANHRTLELASGHLFLVDWCEACQEGLRASNGGQEGEKPLKAWWSGDGQALLMRRGRGKPPMRVEAAQSHDPLILQSPRSFVNGYDYTLASYEGCEYGCSFCYVVSVLRRLPDKIGGWGNYARPRFRCVEHLLRRAQELEGARLFLSATTDPYQRVERHYRLTRSLLEALIDIPFRYLLISTRSGLVLRDLDLFTDERLRGRVEIGISVGSDRDGDVHDVLEPDTPSYAGRFKVARILRDNGIATRIHAAPLGVHTNDFLRKVEQSASWLWIDGTGHGARKEEPARSLLFDYAQARAFAEQATEVLGEERVGYGSSSFGYRWDTAAGCIAPVPPTEALRQRRELTCATG